MYRVAFLCRKNHKTPPGEGWGLGGSGSGLFAAEGRAGVVDAGSETSVFFEAAVIGLVLRIELSRFTTVFVVAEAGGATKSRLSLCVTAEVSTS